MSCLARQQAHHHQELPRSLGVIGAMPGKDFCIVSELGWTDSKVVSQALVHQKSARKYVLKV